MLARLSARINEGRGIRAGIGLYAAGSIAAGVLDLIWGDFEAAHQPIQAQLPEALLVAS